MGMMALARDENAGRGVDLGGDAGDALLTQKDLQLATESDLFLRIQTAEEDDIALEDLLPLHRKRLSSAAAAVDAPCG